MGSYLVDLLHKSEPLERYEVKALADWLDTLKGDCEMFGETDEDTERMARIADKIAQAGGAE